MPRSGNFLQEETEILLNLTERYHDVVNNKRTDHVTNKQKEECWIKISQLFNAATRGEKREWKRLKNHWQNLIYRTKNEYSYRRQHQLKTGGGPPPPPEDPVFSRVFDAMRPQIESKLNTYDDDALFDTSESLDVIAEDQDIAIRTVQFASSTINSTPAKLSKDGVGRPKCSRKGKVEEKPTTSKIEKNMKGLPLQQGSVEEQIYKLAEVEHRLKVTLLEAKLQGVKRKAEQNEELHQKKIQILEQEIKGFDASPKD